jgi:UPF0755 protein
MTSKPTSTQLVLKITSTILRLLLNVVFYAVVIILIVRASTFTYQFCYQIFGQVTASEAPGRDKEIQIKEGESTMNVASKLELNRIVVDKYSFYVKAKLKKFVIMPGTYILNTSMTYDEIFAIITVPSATNSNSEETSNSSAENESKDSNNSKDTDTADDN